MLFFRSRLFLRWVVVYALLLALPTLITGGVSYLLTTRIITEQAEARARTLVQNAGRAVDSVFRDVDTVFVMLQYLPWLSRIVELSENDAARADRYGPSDLLRILTVLRTYRARHPAIAEIAVFIRNADMVIDCEAKYAAGEYLGGRYTVYSERAGSLTSANWTDPAEVFLPDARVQKYNGATLDRVVIVRKIPGGLALAKAAVMFQLDKQVLADALQPFRGSANGSLAAVAASGELVQQVGDLAPDLLARIPRPDRGEQGRIVHGGRAYAYTWGAAEAGGLACLAVTPVSDLFAETRRLGRATVALTACALIFGILLAYASTRRNYLPLRHLAEQLPGRPAGRMADEVAAISRALSEMTSERTELRRRLQEFLPAVRSSLLGRLLAGRGEEVDEAELERCGIRFPAGSVTSAVVVAEPRSPSALDELERAGLSSLVRERIQRILPAAGEACHVLEHDPFEYRLLLSTDASSAEGLRPAFERMVHALGEQPEDWSAVDALAAVGGLHPGRRGAGRAFDEARRAFEARSAFPGASVILYDDLSESIRDEFAFDAEQRRRIIALLESGDPGRTDAYVDELLTDRVMERRIGARGPYALLELLLHALRDTDGIDPHLWQSINFNRLAALADDAARVRFCRETFQRLAAAVGGRVAAAEGLASEIVAFVDANYHDPAMSLTLLGDRFHRSAIYLSRLFKKKTGGNFLDYLNRRRVERAKELLASPAVLIKGVGRMAGFASETSFRRVFHKYEAASPGEFRRRSVQAVRAGGTAAAISGTRS